MSIIISILLFVFLIGSVMAIHEFGHFIVAKKNNVLVYEFSIGMGPAIFKKKKGETLYSLRVLPFGAYVALAGEDALATLPPKGGHIGVNLDGNQVVEIYKVLNFENDAADLKNSAYLKKSSECDVVGTFEDGQLTNRKNQPMYVNISGSNYKVNAEATVQYKDQMFKVAPYDRCFDSKSKKARTAILFAGPLFNIILASFLSMLIYLGTGTSDYTDITGMELTSSYSKSLFEEEDVIYAVNGEVVNDWYDYSNAIYENVLDNDLDTPILDSYTITVLRNDEYKDIDVNPIIYFNSIGIASDNTITDKLVVGVSSSALPNELQVGAEIIEIEGNDVSSWSEFAYYMEQYGKKTGNSCESTTSVTLTVLNNGKESRVTTDAYSDCLLEKLGATEITYSFGISPSSKIFVGDLLLSPIRGPKNLIASTISQLKIIFTSSEIGVDDMVGPVGLFAMTSDIASGGVITFLTFMAFISVNIGILNLLPLPVLDGGRISFIGYEAIAGKPVKKEVEETIMGITVMLFLAFTIYVLFNDIFRFF